MNSAGSMHLSHLVTCCPWWHLLEYPRSWCVDRFVDREEGDSNRCTSSPETDAQLSCLLVRCRLQQEFLRARKRVPIDLIHEEKY